MDAKYNGIKRMLTTGLVVGGLALAGVGTIGCEKRAPEELASSPAAVQAGSAGLESPVSKFAERRTINHNETFLTA